MPPNQRKRRRTTKRDGNNDDSKMTRVMAPMPHDVAMSAAAKKAGEPVDIMTMEAFMECYHMLLEHVEGESSDWDAHQDRLMSMYEFIYSMINSAEVESYGSISAAIGNKKSSILGKANDRFNTMLEEYLTSKLIPGLAGCEAEELIRELWPRWNRYQTLLRCMCFIFRGLGNLFKHPVHVMVQSGRRLFSKLVLRQRRGRGKDKDKGALDGIIQILLHMIESERKEPNSVDGSLVKNTISVLVATDCYADLEERLLPATRSLYRSKSQEWLAHSDCPIYLRLAEAALEHEVRVITPWLSGEAGAAKVLAVFDEECLVAQERTVLELNNGIDRLLMDDKVNDLKLLYRLFSRIHAPSPSTPLYAAFAAHMLAMTKDVTRASSDQPQPQQRTRMIATRVLGLHDKYRRVVSECFRSNPAFIEAVQSCFRDLLNNNGDGGGDVNFPEVFAKYCDLLLRKGSAKGGDNGGSQGENDRDKVLEHAVSLIELISASDVFREYTQMALAKRLVLEKSVDLDAERSFLTLLKTSMGPLFTRNMEKMYDDVIHHTMGGAEFREHCRGIGAHPGVDLSVRVLTFGNWPGSLFSTESDKHVLVHSMFVKFQETFTNYYRVKHSSRRLTWLSQWGTCLLKAKFRKGFFDFVVTHDQTHLLLTLTSNDGAGAGVSVSSLCSQTGLSLRRVNMALLPMSQSNARLILIKKEKENNEEEKEKEKRNASLSASTILQVNADFHSKMRRIKFNAAMMKEKSGESQEVTKRVLQDRDMRVDAAIVRVMKARRKMEHQALVAEVFSVVRVPLQHTQVKRRIEQLIDRDYLRRDRKEGNTSYTYVA